jgi:hypothetical protein
MANLAHVQSGKQIATAIERRLGRPVVIHVTGTLKRF